MRCRYVVVCVAVVCGLLGGNCVAATFSADLHTQSGGHKGHYRLAVSGDNFRADSKDTSWIGRGDIGSYLVLYHDRKEYCQHLSRKKPISNGFIPLRIEHFEDTVKPGGATRKVLGVEKVSGYTCRKIQYDSGNLKPRMVAVVWYSDKLRSPLRIQCGIGQAVESAEYRNIKESKPADSLFEIPAGYKKELPVSRTRVVQKFLTKARGCGNILRFGGLRF